MQRRPTGQDAIVLETPALYRQMLELKNELNLQPLRRLLADREPHRIDNTFLRQARTGVSISKIAGFELHSS